MGNLTRKPVQILLNEVDANSLKLKDSNKTLVIAEYGTIKLAGVQEFFKHTTAASAVKTQSLTIKPYYPSDGKKENFDAGFEIQRSRELTGFAQHMLVDIKRYAGIVTRLGAEKDAYINELDAIDVATQIAAMIRKHDGAIVTAKASIPVTLTATEAAEMTIEVPELNEILVIPAAGTTDTLAKLKTKVDASPLKDFVIVNVAGGVIESKYALKITGVDKAVFGYPKVDLVGKQAIPTFIVKDLEGVGIIGTTVEAARKSFTRDDVARIFPVKWEHTGTQPLVPIPGQDYCKYRFSVKHDMAYALDGANHLDGYLEQVELYVLKSVATGANWDTKLTTFLSGSGFSLT